MEHFGKHMRAAAGENEVDIIQELDVRAEKGFRVFLRIIRHLLEFIQRHEIFFPAVFEISEHLFQRCYYYAAQ